MSTILPPKSVRQLGSPTARSLEVLASIFGDLQTVLTCCERLVEKLTAHDDTDDVELEALWTTALLSYTRCFALGRSGMGLSEQDVLTTGLPGEVLEWHKVLRRLRKHFSDPAQNPRERFSVGVAQDSRGRPSGVVITSTPEPMLDDRTVRQTGALAFKLSELVDQRITEQQERLLRDAEGMSQDSLDRLPLIEVAPSDAIATDDGDAAPSGE